MRTEQLKDQVEDFLLASLLANLVDRDAAALRTADGFPNANLLLFEDAIVQVFELEGQLAGIENESEAVVEPLEHNAAEQWADAASYQLRTPPWTAVTETLRDELGATAEGDFTDIIESLETARGDGAGLDKVTIALLVAARNESLLCDISKWGEDVGLASKATFSRTKSELEELGILSTEKVPMDTSAGRGCG